MNKFTQKLNELLKETNAKQVDICRALHITPQQFTNWKKGYNEPRSIDDLINLADYFDISLDELVGREFV